METLSIPEVKVCEHCAKPLPSVPRAGKHADRFCCAGCATVHQALHEMGLEKFYKLRDTAVPTPAAVREDRHQPFAFLDHADLGVKRLGPSHARVTLTLTGVHCTACVYVLERLPDQLRGIRASRLDFGRSELTVDYDPAQLKLSELGHHLNRLGYAPLEKTESGHESHSRAEGRSQLLRIGVAGFCAANSMMIAVSVWEGMSSGIPKPFLGFFGWVSVLLSIPAVTYASFPFYKKAWQGLRAGVISMDLPISGAILLGFALSTFNAFQAKAQIYFDSINTLVFLLLIGRFVQWKTLLKVRRTLEQSASFLPSTVRKRESSGSTTIVPLSALQVGDEVLVDAADRIPADGIVRSGHSSVDRALLTGETKLFAVGPGDAVLAGALNVSAPLAIAVSATGRKTELGIIEERVRSANVAGTAFQSWVDRSGQWFSIGIGALSVLTLALWVPTSGWGTGLDHLLALWVVSCPCAIGLATPLALSLAVSTAAKEGVLIADVDVFEKVETAKHVVFDKTGTLTEGAISVETLAWTESIPEAERPRILRTLFQAESQVQHPIARALAAALAAYAEEASPTGDSPLPEVEVFLGSGIRSGDLVAGSREWLASQASVTVPWTRGQPGIGVLWKGQPALWAHLSDPIRPEATEVISQLKRLGLGVSLFSGDASEVAQEVGRRLGIDDSRGAMKVQDKATALPKAALMVGDGVNDAPALAVAQVGIGFSGGATAALKAAPVYLAQPNLRKILELLKLARRVRGVVRRNVGIAVLYNLAGSILAVSGLMAPLMAALVMPINSLTVVSATLFAFRRGRP